jgi:hypothetical protein
MEQASLIDGTKSWGLRQLVNNSPFVSCLQRDNVTSLELLTMVLFAGRSSAKYINMTQETYFVYQ